MPDYDSETKDAVPLRPSDDDTAAYVNRLFKRSLKVCRNQHEQIRWARNFYAGAQWDPEDEAKLKSENRPTSVYNFTQRHVNVISGVEILNRLQPTYMARVLDNEQAQRLAELNTGVHEYVMEAGNCNFEKSRTFRAAVNDGIAFLKFRLDLVDHVEHGGRILWENADATHCVWDPDANGQQNLQGMRYIIYFARVPVYEAAGEWPQHADYIKSSAPSDYDDQFGTSARVEQVVPPPYDPINKYETDAIDSSGRSHVIVKEAHWYQDEKYVEYIDPFDPQGGFKEMPKKDWAKFKTSFATDFPQAPALQSMDTTRRVYKRAFIIGGRTMEESDGPLQTGFPVLAITGQWDEQNKAWRGVPWLLKDPQQNLNRYLSQSMHAIATSVKGILLFEDGTFENYTMAEEQWAQWAPFIPMREGAIRDKRYEYIPPMQPSQSTFAMMDICMKVIEEIAGINVEMLGAGEGEVPGITMRQRQAVAMIAMADYFAAYRRFLKEEALRTLEAVKEFYTDERIIRIGGQYDGQAIQLFREDFSYPMDVTIDESPNTPNARDLAFQQMSPIFPTLFKSGAIMQIPSAIDTFPGTAKFRAELKQYVMKMGQQIAQAGGTPGQKQQAGQQGKGKQEDPQVTQGRVALMQTKLQETMAKARKLDTDASLKTLQTLANVLGQRERAQFEKQSAATDQVETVHKVHRENRKAGFAGMKDILGAVAALNKSRQSRNGASA